MGSRRRQAATTALGSDDVGIEAGVHKANKSVQGTRESRRESVEVWTSVRKSVGLTRVDEHEKHWSNIVATTTRFKYRESHRRRARTGACKRALGKLCEAGPAVMRSVLWSEAQLNVTVAETDGRRSPLRPPHARFTLGSPIPSHATGGPTASYRN